MSETINGVWRGRFWLALAAATAALAWGVWTVSAQGSTLSASLSGANEPTPVVTTASGSFSATLGATSLTYTLTGSGTGLTQAHIHQGASGANGPVVAFLFPLNAAGTSSINISGSIAPADLLGPLVGDWDGFVEALTSGNAYVNVHSLANPGGEIRGQIAAAAAPAATGLPATGSGGLTEGDDSGSSALWWALLAGGVVVAGGLSIRRLARGR